MKLNRDLLISVVGLLGTVAVAVTPIAPEGWQRELALAVSGFLTGLGVHLRKKDA